MADQQSVIESRETAKPDRWMTIEVLANTTGQPEDQLAEVELHFLAGPLSGLRLIGFAIWACPDKPLVDGRLPRRVSFPGRTVSVNGEHRHFALLRADTVGGTASLTDAILAAYDATARAHEAVNPANAEVLKERDAAVTR